MIIYYIVRSVSVPPVGPDKIFKPTEQWRFAPLAVFSVFGLIGFGFFGVRKVGVYGFFGFSNFMLSLTS